MLGQRLRRWPNITSAFGKRIITLYVVFSFYLGLEFMIKYLIKMKKKLFALGYERVYLPL